MSGFSPHTTPLLTLLQLADSAFPAGGFAHSDGLEALIDIADPHVDVGDVLVAHARMSLGPGEAWFVRRGHRAADGSPAGILRAAKEDVAARPSRLQREASLTLGGGLLRVSADLATDDEARAVERVRDALGSVTPRATAWGAVARVLGVGEREAAAGLVYAALAGMVNAGVRLRAFGPSEGQRHLRRALTAVDSVGDDPDWATCSPISRSR